MIDWGDAVWGCPLGTMLGTIRSLAFHAGLPEDAAEVRRARDAYLEPFTTVATRTELVRLVDLAMRVGCLVKASSYTRALVDAPLAEEAGLDFPVRAWLRDLVEASRAS